MRLAKLLQKWASSCCITVHPLFRRLEKEEDKKRPIGGNTKQRCMGNIVSIGSCSKGIYRNPEPNTESAGIVYCLLKYGPVSMITRKIGRHRQFSTVGEANQQWPMTLLEAIIGVQGPVPNLSQDWSCLPKSMSQSGEEHRICNYCRYG